MENEDQKMEIISDLMDQLQDLMGDSSDDFSSRLGRDKPEMMDEDAMDGGSDDSEEEDPDDSFKMRIMRMRA